MSRFLQPPDIDTEGYPDDPEPLIEFAPGDPDGSKTMQALSDREAIDDEKRRMRLRETAREELRAERDAYLLSEEGRAEAAARFESQIIDLDDLEDPEPIIDGFLYRDSLVRTFGPPKSLKSFVTLDMAASVSLGMPWQGRPTVQTTVLYVVAEGARGVKKRRRAWNEHHGTEMKVIFFPKPVQIGDQQQMFDLIAFCHLKQVGYVVFDTQARCTVGVEENDNTEMGEIVGALDILKQQTGACVHLVHHSGAGDAKRARGATAFDGAVDAEFYTVRDSKDTEVVTFVSKFQKDVAEADDVHLLAREVAGSLVMIEEVTAGIGSGEVAPALVTDGQVLYLEAIRMFGNQGASVSDVVTDLADRNIKRTRTAVKKAFGGLLSGGAVAQTGRGTAVVLTQAGLVFLDAHRRQADDSQEALSEGFGGP